MAKTYPVTRADGRVVRVTVPGAEEAAAPDPVPFLLEWSGGKRDCPVSGPGGLLMAVLDVQSEMRRAGHEYAGVSFRGLERRPRLHSAGNFMAWATGEELDEACGLWWVQALRVRGEQLEARLAKVLRGETFSFGRPP